MINDIGVWIVEDGRHFRESIELFVESRSGMRCDLAVDSAERALAALREGRVADVVLLDLGLPGLDGLETIGRIRSLSPDTRIVVLTVRDDDSAVFQALCAGACGYLLKPSNGDEIAGAIRIAMEGGAPMNAFVARKVLDMFDLYVRPAGDYGLTDREREILLHLTEESTKAEIAERLFLSPHTVDTHLRNIYSKLHVQSRTGAVAKALRERLI